MDFKLLIHLNISLESQESITENEILPKYIGIFHICI